MSGLKTDNGGVDNGTAKGKARANASEAAVHTLSGPTTSTTGPARDMQIFNGIVPVPMLVPGEEYGKRRPWFYGVGRD